MSSHTIKIIISGGGTGGHVFPAISIANELKRVGERIDILFVGASGRMEMERVPAAGYDIEGLPVRGFHRKNVYKNIMVLYYLVLSMIMARRIINRFRPDVVVGVGGYASGPVVRVASMTGIPVLIQEQNSYAGVTNRILARKAARICVAYEGMEKYFPAGKIVITGNPVRQDILNLSGKRNEALSRFGIDGDKKVILVLGGSLGAESLNRAISGSISKIREAGLALIWQTGTRGIDDAKETIKRDGSKEVQVYEFISRMDLAYAVADIVISRAGAGTISELAVTGKASILVPSPNVAEDHQTRNAMSLAGRNAALLVKDHECGTKLVPLAINLARDPERRAELEKNITGMAVSDSAARIAAEIMNLVKKE